MGTLKEPEKGEEVIRMRYKDIGGPEFKVGDKKFKVSVTKEKEILDRCQYCTKAKKTAFHSKLSFGENRVCLKCLRNLVPGSLLVKRDRAFLLAFSDEQSGPFLSCWPSMKVVNNAFIVALPFISLEAALEEERQETAPGFVYSLGPQEESETGAQFMARLSKALKTITQSEEFKARYDQWKTTVTTPSSPR